MPILDIEYVGEVKIERLAQKIADSVGAVLKSAPGGTWVKLKLINHGDYAENGSMSSELKPVFVSILVKTLPEVSERARIAKEISESIAKVFDRPTNNVHILFLPEGLGRMAFGGQLVT